MSAVSKKVTPLSNACRRVFSASSASTGPYA
jgi:hypothetical protein